MKKLILVIFIVLFVSCGNDDDQIIQGCDIMFTSKEWRASNDSIIDNGIVRYKVDVLVEIVFDCEQQNAFLYEAVSNSDVNGNVFTAEAPYLPILTDFQNPLMVGYTSENYFSQEQISLGIDYIKLILLE